MLNLSGSIIMEHNHLPPRQRLAPSVVKVVLQLEMVVSQLAIFFQLPDEASEQAHLLAVERESVCVCVRARACAV